MNKRLLLSVSLIAIITATTAAKHDHISAVRNYHHHQHHGEAAELSHGFQVRDVEPSAEPEQSSGAPVPADAERNQVAINDNYGDILANLLDKNPSVRNHYQHHRRAAKVPRRFQTRDVDPSAEPEEPTEAPVSADSGTNQAGFSNHYGGLAFNFLQWLIGILNTIDPKEQ